MSIISLWGFPIVVVDKKDGTKRFCTDFRKLNNILKMFCWPFLVTYDMLAALGKAKYFTSLDLKSRYWQLPLTEGDKEKTAFTHHRGLYVHNVVPFGLANAPGILQELISIVLDGLGDFAMAYLETIICSASEKEHKQHIQKHF